MTLWSATILVFTQGISEFLPISSSGHLLLAQSLLGLKDLPLLFSVVLHLATMCSVLVFFHRKIGGLLCALPSFLPGVAPRPGQREDRLWVGSIVLATLATVPVALLIRETLEWWTGRALLVTSAGFFVTGLLLLLQARFAPAGKQRPLNARTALLVGLAQGMAVLPGLSRSGLTISLALMLGMDRKQATSFSLLISLPAIVGALLLELRQLELLLRQLTVPLLLFSFAATFLVGLCAIRALSVVVQRRRAHVFSIYLIPLSVATMLWSFYG